MKDYTEYFERIINSSFYKKNYKGQTPTFMLHGTKDSNDIKIIKINKDRSPRHSYRIVHDWTNRKSEETFGERLRSGFFTSFAKSRITVYGSENVAIPLGNYNLYQHETISDFTIGLSDTLKYEVSDRIEKEIKTYHNSSQMNRSVIRAIVHFSAKKATLDNLKTTLKEVIVEQLEKRKLDLLNDFTLNMLVELFYDIIMDEVDNIATKYIDGIVKTQKIKDLNNENEVVVITDAVILIPSEKIVKFWKELKKYERDNS